MPEGYDPNSNVSLDGKKLKRPVEEVRAELMADPDVKEQARLVKLPLEQYVEKIIDYALHPQKPAQLQIVPDEELKARDPSIPTVGELQTYLEKINSGEISISPAHQKDGFSQDGQKEYASALGSLPPKGPPQASSTPSAQAQAVKKTPTEES
jgi:hypothetical protein